MALISDQDITDEDAIDLRRVNHEAPRPYLGWKDSIRVELPEPKEQLALWRSRDRRANPHLQLTWSNG